MTESCLNKWQTFLSFTLETRFAQGAYAGQSMQRLEG
jgi:hypothetical protein